MPARKRARGFSFDDGAHWASAAAHLPTTPVHDLLIHGDDLVVPLTAARSGCSMTSVRCARRTPRSPAKKHTCSRLVPQFARAWGTPTPPLRHRRKSARRRGALLLFERGAQRSHQAGIAGCPGQRSSRALPAKKRKGGWLRRVGKKMKQRSTSPRRPG